MDVTAIAAASITMHAGQMMEAVSVTMAKKAMETQEAIAAQTIQSIQAANPAPAAAQVARPSFGHILDITV